ncbi:hypothetical protein Mic7113_6443 (plasmid) [Allocoleopsis franciscana PCC 7113]|uniref:Uncharacterized protein n=1 Tax=Allocoleopsis franciscana PCC 7113 TaxID=1173027 RepID=K9WPA9_9CYAN|nr:hypothetical protein Mic7113_6443 [Allocoleopsis franciscana PCC 7113]
MNPNPDFNSNNISKCSEKLELILEAYGSDVFFEAITELLNFHPLTAPPTSSSKSWIILLLPSYCNPDSLSDTHNLTLTSVSNLE